MFNEFINEVKKDYKDNFQYHAVLLFNTELELGISNSPNKWVCTRQQLFTDGIQALDYYINTPNPASQLVSATSLEELYNEIEKTKNNFKNEDWLNNVLYPQL